MSSESRRWLSHTRTSTPAYYLAYYRNNFGAMDLEDEDVWDPDEVPDEDEVFAS